MRMPLVAFTAMKGKMSFDLAGGFMGIGEVICEISRGRTHFATYPKSLRNIGITWYPSTASRVDVPGGVAHANFPLLVIWREMLSDDRMNSVKGTSGWLWLVGHQRPRPAPVRSHGHSVEYMC